MSISEAGELLDVLKGWKDAGLKFSRDSHPAVLVGSEAHALLARLLDEQERANKNNQPDEPFGDGDPAAKDDGPLSVTELLTWCEAQMHVLAERIRIDGPSAANHDHLIHQIGRKADALARAYCPPELILSLPEVPITFPHIYDHHKTFTVLNSVAEWCHSQLGRSSNAAHDAHSPPATIGDSIPLQEPRKMPEHLENAARDHLRAAVGHLTQFYRSQLYPEFGREATNAEYLSAWISRLRALGDVISELGLIDFLSRTYCPVEFDAIQTKTLLLHACRQPRDVAGLQDLMKRLGADEDAAEEWKLQNKLGSVGVRIKEACDLLERAFSAEPSMKSPAIADAQPNHIPQPAPSTPPAAN